MMECLLAKMDKFTDDTSAWRTQRTASQEVMEANPEKMEPNSGDCASQRKLAAACRKVSRRGRVAWRKRNTVRNKWTRTKVERATRTVRPLRKNLWMHHEGRWGTKDLSSKQPLYLRKKRATTIGIGGWSSGQLSSLGRGGTNLQDPQEDLRTGICEASKHYVQWVVEGEKTDLVEGSAPSGVRKQGSDIVEGSTPSETKKETADRAGVSNVEAPAPRERERAPFKEEVMVAVEGWSLQPTKKKKPQQRKLTC
jgi:hypothetical protein